MTDRDTFAAAALTGMLDKHDAAEPKNMAAWWPEFVCSAAYRWADAMLREREQAAQKMAEIDSSRAAERDKTSAEKTTGSVSVTLTDAEREAVELCVKLVRNINKASRVFGCESQEDSKTEQTLRGLLERLK